MVISAITPSLFALDWDNLDQELIDLAITLLQAGGDVALAFWNAGWGLVDHWIGKDNAFYVTLLLIALGTCYVLVQRFVIGR